MAKKRRTPNPNLKYSQASKRDEGNKHLEEVIIMADDEAEATMVASPATGIAASSPTKQGGGFTQTSVMEKNGDAAAPIGRIQRRHLSKTLKSDTIVEEEATSGKSEESGATSSATSPLEEASGFSAQVVGATATPDSQTGTSAGIIPNSSMVLRNGAINSKGMKLKFFPPMVKQGVKTVQLQPSELDAESAKWKFALVFYVIGIKPSFNAIRNYVCHLWKKIVEPRVFLHNDGYFILRFNCNVIDEIVSNGPYMFAGKPVVVKPWYTGFDFQAEVNRCVPVWVRFPNLPLPYWSENSLSRIGSALGVPICSDKCTAQQHRISYARMLIEIDITRPLDSSIMVDGGQGQASEQRVIYEWVPPFCSKCCQVGHNCEHKATGGKKKKSKNKGKRIWVEKTHKGEEKNKKKKTETREEEGVNEGEAKTNPATPLDGEAAGVADQQCCIVTAASQHPVVCSSKAQGSISMRQDLVQGSSISTAASQMQQEGAAAEGTAVEPSDTVWPGLSSDTRLQKTAQSDVKAMMKPSECTTPDASSYLNITMRKVRGNRLPP